jgi:hypothetical protein
MTFIDTTIGSAYFGSSPDASVGAVVVAAFVVAVEAVGASVVAAAVVAAAVVAAAAAVVAAAVVAAAVVAAVVAAAVVAAAVVAGGGVEPHAASMLNARTAARITKSFLFMLHLPGWFPAPPLVILYRPPIINITSEGIYSKN